MSLRISSRELRHADIPRAQTIGVCSLNRNAGVTTICLALCSYLCSKKQRDTAYVEINSTDAIGQLNVPQQKGPYGSFYLQGVCFYPQVREQSVPELLRRRHRYYVLDFGAQTTLPSEFLRCDKRLILCDFSPWKQNRLKKQLEMLADQIKVQELIITFLFTTGKYNRPDQLLKRCEFQGKISGSVLEIPYIPNPFQITSNTFEVFEKIIKEYNTTHVS